MLLPKLVRSVPSAITLTSLCLGLWSIRFTVDGNEKLGIICILISVVLDGMDGKLARYLNNSTSFGATLDTLADFASFGIAPALLVYYTYLHTSHQSFWLCVLFFAICMSLRLARFTSNPAKSSFFFIGVPAPAGALLCLAPSFLVLSGWCQPSPAMHGICVAITGALLISRIPTFAFTKFKIPNQWMPSFSLSVAMGVSAFFVAPWQMLILTSAGYILTFPFSYFAYKKVLAHSRENASNASNA